MEDVKLFDMLSEPLATEIKEHIYEEALMSSLLFSKLKKRYPATASLICSKLFPRCLAAKDRVYSFGEIALRTLYLECGELRYRKGRASDWINDGQWLSSAALWTAWIHLGSMHSTMETELLALDVSDFADAVSLQPKAHQYCSKYAKRYVSWLNSQNAEALSDVSKDDSAFLTRYMSHTR